MKKHVKHIKKIKKTTQSHKIPALLFAVIFAGLGVYILTLTQAADPGTIKLTPSTSTVSQGSNITVTVTVNSGSSVISTVEADLKFDPAKLQFVSATSVLGSNPGSSDPAACTGLDTPIESQVYPDDLTLLRITSGDSTPCSGQQTLATATFKAIGTGSASISIDPGSHVFLHDPAAAAAGVSTELFTTAGSTGTNITINDTTAPSVPTGIVASGTTVKSTNLSWTASTDNVAVAGYDVYKGNTYLASTTSTSYPVTGLTPSTAYTFKVLARDAVPNSSGFSNVVNVTTLADTTAPSAPTNPQTTTTSTTAMLTWFASTDDVAVGGYDIFQSNGTTKIGTTTSNTYTVTGLTPGTPYQFKVQAFDTASPTPNRSAQVTFSGTTVADSQPPSKPALNTNPSKTNTSVTLTWTASTDNIGVTKYDVLNGSTVVGTVTGSTYTVTNLIPGTAHSFKVQAFDAANNSTQSDAVSATLGIKGGDITRAIPVLVNGVNTYPPDDKVDGTDFQVIAFNWRKPGGNATRAQGDLTGDGLIEANDLSVLFSSWGK